MDTVSYLYFQCWNQIGFKKLKNYVDKNYTYKNKFFLNTNEDNSK